MEPDFYCERDVVVAGEKRCERQCWACEAACERAAETKLDTEYLEADGRAA